MGSSILLFWEGQDLERKLVNGVTNSTFQGALDHRYHAACEPVLGKGGGHADEGSIVFDGQQMGLGKPHLEVGGSGATPNFHQGFFPDVYQVVSNAVVFAEGNQAGGVGVL